MANYLDNPVAQMMYHNALINLSNGSVNEIDREVLSRTPLPSNFIDPYVMQDVEAITAMDLAFTSLTVWIEEAQKTNYFSLHFITLSKLIMDGVTTMARGLATLHAKGEALDRAPMSIQELISIGSYHVRKSHLGVLQTVKSHPEISERLLMNQMKWTNTLLRLYKTREKLDEKPVLLNLVNELDIKSENIPAIEAGITDDQALPPAKESSFSEASALHEPGKYAPLRAYSPACRQNKKANQVRETEPGGQQSPDDSKAKTNEKMTNKQETKESDKSETKLNKTIKSKETENKAPEEENTNSKVPETGGNNNPETEPSQPEQIEPDQSPDSISEADKETPYDPNSFIPMYLQILCNVMKRSLHQPPYTLVFKYGEVKLLLNDKIFLKEKPDIARQLKKLFIAAPPNSSDPYRIPFPDETLLRVKFT